MLIRYLYAWLGDSNLFAPFIPLVVKTFFLAIIFAIPWFLWLLLDRRKNSQQHKSSRKGATP
jgi:hypothetical protein